MSNRYVKYKPIYDEWIKFYPLTLDNLDDEEWRPVPNYEGYQVSNYGRVKSLKKREPYIMIPSINKNGYLIVLLSKNNKRKLFLISRLVALSFIPNTNGKPQVNHIFSRFNNYVDCLEWATGSENMRHAFAFGLQENAKGEDNYAAKITNDQAEYIRKNPDNLSGVQLAKKFSVCKQTITNIQLGKTFKNVNGRIRDKQQALAELMMQYGTK